MDDQALVMFDDFSKVLIPVNQGLFRVSQFKSEGKLNEMYQGNWILYPDGVIRSIKKVDITGYYGSTFWKKVFGLLNSTHNIRVVLEEITPSMGDLKNKAKVYLENDLASNNPYLDQQDISKIDFDKITSTKQLYSALSLPLPEDCLDVM